VSQLTDENPSIRRRGAAKLGRLRDPKGVPHLLGLFGDKEPMVRATAVDSIGLLRAKEALGQVVGLLRGDKDPQVRLQAATALSYFADPSSEGTLIDALADKAAGVRYAAARALGTMRSKAAGPKLGELLTSPDPGMRRAAAGALVRIRDKGSIPALKKALKDDDVYVRREAVKALGLFGSDAGLGGDLKPLLEDDDALVKINAATALHGMGDSSGERVVVKLLQDKDIRVRQQAANAIGTIGTRAVGLSALERAAASEDHPQVKRALEFNTVKVKSRLGIKEPSPAPEPSGKKGKKGR